MPFALRLIDCEFGVHITRFQFFVILIRVDVCLVDPSNLLNETTSVTPGTHICKSETAKKIFLKIIPSKLG